MIQSASVESNSVYNGIGLVKLMGRNSGIGQPSLAQRNVDFVLIPEQPFVQEKQGFLQAMKKKSFKNRLCFNCCSRGSRARIFSDEKFILVDIGKYLSQK